jgi:hypothetical protein
MRAALQVRSGDPECEWQVRARPGQVRGGLGLGPDPIATHGSRQQRLGFRLSEDVEADAVGTVPGGQAGQPVPAGHQYGTPGVSRQQRPYLLRAVRVVQDHQQPLAGQEAAVEVRRLVGVHRDLLGRDAE